MLEQGIFYGGEALELPIYIDNEIRGELRCTQQGLYQIFEAEIKDTGELRRLYLVGSEVFFSLGLFRPEGGRARLYKKLTRLQCEALPQNISHAEALLYDKVPQLSVHKITAKKSCQEEKPRQIWRELPDGCLLACIRNQQYLAIPAKLKGRVRGIRRIKYKKLEYIVFRY